MLTRREIIVILLEVGIRDLSDLKRKCRVYERMLFPQSRSLSGSRMAA